MEALPGVPGDSLNVHDDGLGGGNTSGVGVVIREHGHHHTVSGSGDHNSVSPSHSVSRVGGISLTEESEGVARAGIKRGGGAGCIGGGGKEARVEGDIDSGQSSTSNDTVGGELTCFVDGADGGTCDVPVDGWAGPGGGLCRLARSGGNGDGGLEDALEEIGGSRLLVGEGSVVGGSVCVVGRLGGVVSGVLGDLCVQLVHKDLRVNGSGGHSEVGAAGAGGVVLE